MSFEAILNGIAAGRTDRVLELLRLPGWRDSLREGDVKPLQWLVYYGDVTALRAVLEAGGDLSSIDLGAELGNAAFFGHWKVCDLLLAQGAPVDWRVPDAGETPLHSSLCRAGRPDAGYVVRLLLDHGADVNARTTPGVATGAFMRDVRTKGETPLHRAAAYADAATIALLLERGADRTARDARGDSPLTWASEHLRPGAILAMLAFEPHKISDRSRDSITTDHGSGWGTGMDRKLLGEYLPERQWRK